MEKLMRANFLSTSFNFTSRKRQKYRERKRGNKNSLSLHLLKNPTFSRIHTARIL